VSVWEIILKYSGLVSIMVTLIAFVRVIYLNSKKPIITDESVFVILTYSEINNFCLSFDLTNPAAKTISISNVGIASYEDSDLFYFAKQNPIYIMGFFEQHLDSTSFPITLSPGETKHIIAGYHILSEQLNTFHFAESIKFDDIVAFEKKPVDDRLEYIRNELRKVQDSRVLSLLCKIQTHKKIYQFDINATYENPLIKLHIFMDRHYFFNHHDKSLQ
jgi:hypothetical protein